MKRNAKILLLVLSLALIACAFAFGISAEDKGGLPTLANDHQFLYQIRYEYSDGTGTEYDEILVGNDLRLFLKDKCGVDKHNNKTLAATYIKLFSDATVYTKTQYDGTSITDVTSGWMVNYFKSPVTLDLGGHTLTMNEGTDFSKLGNKAPFYCNGQAFTITGSGTINTSGIQPFTANTGIFNILGDENKILINVNTPSSYVFNATNGGTINLENVDVRLTGSVSVGFIIAQGKFEIKMENGEAALNAYTTDGTFTAEDCIFIDDRTVNNNHFINAKHHPYVELKDCFVLTRAANFFTISSGFSYALDTNGDGKNETFYPTHYGKEDGYLMEQQNKGREGVLVLDNTQVYAPNGCFINEGTTTIAGGEPEGDKDPCRIVLKNGTTYSAKNTNSIKNPSRLSIPDTTANNLGYLDVSAYHAGFSGDFVSSWITAGKHVILLTDATLKYSHNAGTDTSLPPDQIIAISKATTINLNGKTLNLNQARHANYGLYIIGNVSFVGTGTINVEHNVFQQSGNGILNITGDSAQNPITINYVASRDGHLFYNWYGAANNMAATNLKYVNINVTSSGTSLSGDTIVYNIGRNDTKPHNKPYTSFTAENCNFKVDNKGGTATPKALFYGANTTSFVLKNCNIEDSSATTFLFEEYQYSCTRTDSGTTYAPFGNNPLYGCVIDIDGTTITNTAGNLITDNTKISGGTEKVDPAKTGEFDANKVTDEDIIVKIHNNSTITAAGKIIVFTTNDSGDSSPDDLKIYFGTDGNANDKVTLRLLKGEENLSQNKSETAYEIFGLENVIYSNISDIKVAYYVDGEFLEEETLPAASAITKAPGASLIDDAGNLTIYGWDLQKLPLVADALKKDGDGRVIINKTKTTTTVDFAVINNKDNVVAYYGTDGEALRTAMNSMNAETGAFDYTVRFYAEKFEFVDKNGAYITNAMFKVVGGKKLVVDFNGAHVVTGGHWFVSAEKDGGANILVKSSKPGAIYQSGRFGYDKTNNVEDPTKPRMFGSAMVIVNTDVVANDTNRVDIKIEGENLTVSGSSCLETNSRSNKPTNPVYITVDGGVYARTVGDNNAPFAVNTDVQQFIVKNATIINNNNKDIGCFASTHEGNVNYVIENCDIIAYNKGNKVFNLSKTTAADMTATLKNCRIHGTLGVTASEGHEGKIILVGENYFSGVISGTEASLFYKADDNATEVALKLGTNYGMYRKDTFGDDFSVIMPYFLLNQNKTDIEEKYLFIHPMVAADSDYAIEEDYAFGSRIQLEASAYKTGTDIKTVTYNDGEGNTLATQYYANGGLLKAIDVEVSGSITSDELIYEYLAHEDPWAAVVADTPVTEDVDYKAAYNENATIKPDAVTAIQTVEQFGGFKIAILIPAKYAALEDVTIEINGEAYTAEDAEDINGELYFVFVSEVGVLAADEDVTKTLYYKQGEFEYEATYTTSILGYCKDALKEEEVLADENALATINNLINYIKAAYASVEDKIEGTVPKVDSTEYDWADAEATDTTAIAGKLNVAVELGAAPKFIFKNVSGEALTVTVAYTDVRGEAVSADFEVAADETFELVTMVYNFAKTLTITIGEDEGTYNLAKYCAETADISDELEAICEALYNYVKASETYVTSTLPTPETPDENAQ